MKKTTIERVHEQMFIAREVLEANPEKPVYKIFIHNCELEFILELAETYGTELWICRDGRAALYCRHYINDHQYIWAQVVSSGNRGVSKELTIESEN